MLDKDLQAWIIGKPKNKDTVLSGSAFLPVVELAPVRAPALETAPVAKESSFDDQNPPFIEELLEAEEIPQAEKTQPEPRDEAVIQEPVMARETREPTARSAFSHEVEDAARNLRVAQLTEQFRQNQRAVQSGLRKKRLWMLLLLLLLLGLLGAWGVFAWNKARSVVVQPPEPAPVLVSQDIAPPEPEPVSQDIVSDEVVSSEVVMPVEIVILPPPSPQEEISAPPEPDEPVKVETPPPPRKASVSKPAQKKPTPVVKPKPAKKPPAKPAPAPAKKTPPSDSGIVIPGAPPRDPRIFRPPRGGLLLCPF